jgi:hypothetical protein
MLSHFGVMAMLISSLVLFEPLSIPNDVLKLIGWTTFDQCDKVD